MTGLSGTASLLRLAARRDRVLIPTSALALVVVVAGSAQATVALYPDESAALAPLRAVLANPALTALYGPITSESLDSFATFKTILTGAVFLCLLAYVVVRRHTRTEEEEGRLELLGAGAIGRRAPLAAAVLLGTVAVLGTALLTMVGAIAAGLGRTGSVALGVSWIVMGLTWVGVTAVAAQLTETARGTAGFALGALALAYLLRALGDVAADDSPLRLLTWLSPLGWGEKVAPYGANRFWLLAVGLVAYAALLIAAFVLQSRRDLGAGILPSRVGPARGRLHSSLALTLRLARGTLVGWFVAFVVLGAVVGSLAGNVQSFLDSPETADLLRKMGGSDGSIVDTFFATEIHVAAVAAAALGISLVTRLRTEETAGLAEAVLATTVPRRRWALEHLVVAMAGTAVLMACLGVVAGALDSGRTGDVAGSIGRLSGAALSTLPAVWVCIAVAAVLIGVAPRFTGVSWAVLIAFFTLGEFGDLLGLPAVVSGLSPFAHLPSLPGGETAVGASLVLLGVAALCAAIGLEGLRRRDLPFG